MYQPFKPFRRSPTTRSLVDLWSPWLLNPMYKSWDDADMMIQATRSLGVSHQSAEVFHVSQPLVWRICVLGLGLEGSCCCKKQGEPRCAIWVEAKLCVVVMMMMMMMLMLMLMLMLMMFMIWLMINSAEQKQEEHNDKDIWIWCVYMYACIYVMITIIIIIIIQCAHTHMCLTLIQIRQKEIMWKWPIFEILFDVNKKIQHQLHIVNFSSFNSFFLISQLVLPTNLKHITWIYPHPPQHASGKFVLLSSGFTKKCHSSSWWRAASLRVRSW